VKQHGRIDPGRAFHSTHRPNGDGPCLLMGKARLHQLFDLPLEMEFKLLVQFLF
jgi:hypothetical protein